MSESYSNTTRSLSISDTLKLAFGLNIQPATLSSIEIAMIKQRQLILALASTLAINVVTCAIIIAIWIYITLFGDSRYANPWLATHIIGYTMLFSAWIINRRDIKYKRKMLLTKFTLLNLPGLFIISVGSGVIPSLIDASFNTNNYIGEALLIAFLAPSIVCGFPLFLLSCFSLLTICGTLTYSQIIFETDKSLLACGLISLYGIVLLYVLYLGLSFFIRWVVNRIKYKQKSELINLFLKDFEENATDWLWQTNATGYINHVSVRLIEVTDLSREQLEQFKLLDFFKKNEPATIQLEKTMNQRKSFINLKIPLQLKEEERVWNLTANPIYDHNNSFLGYRGVGSDITKHHLLDTIEEEKKRYESFSQISGILSHDFNNLLASISLRLELVRTSEGVSTEDKKYLAEALDVCQNLAKITSQMLVYSRRESLEPTNFSLNAAIDSVIREINADQGNTINFVINNNSSSYYVWCDETLFHNALINILNNAVRAIHKTGKIYIKKDMIAIAKSTAHLKRGNYIYVSIEDNGIGFDSKALKMAFDPFYTQYRNEGGSGLGLSMVQGFIKQSNGYISLSNGEHGAKVAFYLPAGIAAIAQSRKKDLNEANDYNYNILLVEDNIDFGSMLTKYLEANSFNITYVHNVTSAKKTLDYDTSINFIISDFLLPDGNGSDIIKYARLKYNKIPALYISGFLDKSLSSSLEKASVLKKPFTLEELKEAIYKAANAH